VRDNIEHKNEDGIDNLRIQLVYSGQGQGKLASLNFIAMSARSVRDSEAIMVTVTVTEWLAARELAATSPTRRSWSIGPLLEQTLHCHVSHTSIMRSVSSALLQYIADCPMYFWQNLSESLTGRPSLSSSVLGNRNYFGPVKLEAFWNPTHCRRRSLITV